MLFEIPAILGNDAYSNIEQIGQIYNAEVENKSPKVNVYTTTSNIESVQDNGISFSLILIIILPFVNALRNGR